MRQLYAYQLKVFISFAIWRNPFRKGKIKRFMIVWAPQRVPSKSHDKRSLPVEVETTESIIYTHNPRTFNFSQTLNRK